MNYLLILMLIIFTGSSSQAMEDDGETILNPLNKMQNLPDSSGSNENQDIIPDVPISSSSLPFKQDYKIRTNLNSDVTLIIPLNLSFNHVENIELQKVSDSKIPDILRNIIIGSLESNSFNRAALLIIASIWSEKEDIDLINNLEDTNPGIYNEIVEINSIDDLNKVHALLNELLKSY